MIKPASLMNKHSANDHESRYFEPDVGIVLIMKTPVKWIDSMCRNAWNFTDFYDIGYKRGHTPVTIRYNPYNFEPDGNLEVPVSLERLAQFYVDYHRYWFERLPRWPGGYMTVTHRSATEDPSTIVRQVADHWNITVKEPFVIPTDIPKTRHFDRENSLREDYVEFLTPEQVAIIERITSES